MSKEKSAPKSEAKKKPAKTMKEKKAEKRQQGKPAPIIKE